MRPAVTTDAERAARFEVQRARYVQALVNRLPRETEKVTWSLERLWTLRDERLRTLVGHAKASSPWHRRRLARVNPDRLSVAGLADLPTMSKADLMSNWDEIVTDRRITLDSVLRHVEDVELRGMKLYLGNFVAVTTAGSTGERAVLVRDFDGLVESTLASIRNVNWWRRHSPRPLPSRDRQARLFSESPVHITSVIGRVFERPDRQSLTLPSSMRAGEVVDRLRHFRPTRVIGYPSALLDVAAELDARGSQVPVWDVATNAEVLREEARPLIEAAFTATIRNVYGSTETGTIAESRHPHRALQLIEDSCVLEPVEADASPTPLGDLSHHVLATNLVNLVLPLIRYEIGDRLRMSPAAAPGPQSGRVVSEVAGRTSDDFWYGDLRLSVALLRSQLATVVRLTDYQVVQLPQGIRVRVTARPEFDTAPLRARLLAALRQAGLIDPLVVVEQVAALPREGPTSKLRAFVPIAPDLRRISD